MELLCVGYSILVSQSTWTAVETSTICKLCKHLIRCQHKQPKIKKQFTFFHNKLYNRYNHQCNGLRHNYNAWSFISFAYTVHTIHALPL